MQEKSQKIFLPFASQKNRDSEEFAQKIEKASIFCLSELNREKGGGLFKKKDPEKLAFIAKAYYPFRIVPFRDFALLFDGLNLMSHAVKNPAIPDLKNFRDIMNTTFTRQAYNTFLTNQINYFKNYDEKDQIIDGLVYDADFLTELMVYLKESKPVPEPVLDGVLISPSYTDDEIKNITEKLTQTYNEVSLKLQGLNEVIKLLNAKTQHSLEQMQDEIKGIDAKYNGPIKTAQLALEEKKGRINKDYSTTVTDVTRTFENDILDIQKEIVKYEKIRDDVNSKLDKIEKEIKKSILDKDDTSEEKWKQKREDLKNQLSRNSQLIGNLESKKETIEENKKTKLFELNQQHETKLKDASKNLLEIESARDAEKRLVQNEMEKIEDLTSKVTLDIDKLSKMLETALINFDTLGARRESAPSLLVYVPFYLIYYMVDSKRRFSYVSPSYVNSRDISTRLKAIGRKQISQILQPRSQKIVSILNKLMVLLGENVPFSHEISQACNKVSLLRSIEAIDEVKFGLMNLKDAGWLSESELYSFDNSLS